ncbi:hypothetical protein BS50DRAFT_579981 [Corynespora cassiicola Philippines]|uniref:Calcium-dependent phosphotriesterase n=1 Tax=Corynespora cassiicola Philippines TaxID=1448308 RepID=A0A2T2N2Y9_CORCC|nr:hypothetical protein BS50DRAFT_579981 [Corynespora cassiicola Philippines]
MTSAISVSDCTAKPTRNRRHASYDVHQFSYPSWVENIHIRHTGELIVTQLMTSNVYLIDPKVARTNVTSTTAGVSLLHSYPTGQMLLGIAEVSRDEFYVVSGNMTSERGSYSVWSLDLREYDDKSNTGVKAHQITIFPESGLLNGMDTLDPSNNLVVIADSWAGLIWVLNVKSGEKSMFLNETETQQREGHAMDVSANGVKVIRRQGEADVYFSNTAKELFCRITVSLSTLQKISPVQVLNDAIAIDDFAIDADNNVAYVAGGRQNTLYSIPLPGGQAEPMIGSLNQTILAGPTSTAIGRGVVYIATSGSSQQNPQSGFSEGAKIVAVEVGG